MRRSSNLARAKSRVQTAVVFCIYTENDHYETTSFNVQLGIFAVHIYIAINTESFFFYKVRQSIRMVFNFYHFIVT